MRTARLIFLLFFLLCLGPVARAAYCEGGSRITCYEGVDRSGRSSDALFSAALEGLSEAKTSAQTELARQAIRDAVNPAMSDQRAIICNNSHGGPSSFVPCMQENGFRNKYARKNVEAVQRNVETDKAIATIFGLTVAASGLVLLTWAAGIALYFVPSIIGASRRTSGLFFLVICNVFFGWTIVGWLGCLLWAALAQSGLQRAVYRKMLAPERRIPAACDPKSGS